MRFILLLLITLNFGRAYAGPAWAYCDGNKRAYKTVQRVVLDCPKPKPGGPAVKPELPDPETCASRTVTVSVNHPELDYICAYPTAAESGADIYLNNRRCINADKKHCQIGAGGEAGPGGHEIPALAWYHQTAAGKYQPEIQDIRCECGCFVGDTLISGIHGHERIDVLAERATSMPIGVLQYSPINGQSQSRPLRGPDFVVGPEDKPVIRIATEAGAQLAVTDIHPVLVLRGESLTMLQAKDIEAGDFLMGENGDFDPVLSLASYKLDPLSNKVYNLDTKSDHPDGHVISANKILVGDLYWQKLLSEKSSRAENILASAIH